MAPITVQQTSKPIKAVILISVAMMAGAAALAWRLYETPQLKYAGLLFALGLGLYLGARLLKWWQYG